MGDSYNSPTKWNTFYFSFKKNKNIICFFDTIIIIIFMIINFY